MSAEERHFRARVPKPQPPPPVDVRIANAFGTLYARPCTDAGRAFLRERFWHPHEYVDQPLELQPGRYWEVFRADLKAAGLRAQYDDNGQEVE